MKFGIIASKKDIAGMNIVKKLEELGSKIPVYITDKEIVNAENVDKKIDFDFIIFASKHQSVKKIKTLTVHPIGNWKKADYGGKDKTICSTNALALKYFLKVLDKNAKSTKNIKDNYLVSMEATHHGPFVLTPCLFIEVGSSKDEWNDLTACEVVAKSIIECVANFSDFKNKEKNYKIAFGIGGPHYCPNFNAVQLGEKYALGHVVAEYGLPLDKKIIQQIIDKTTEKIENVIIDWKGCGNAVSRKKVLDVLNEFDLEIIKTRDAR